MRQFFIDAAIAVVVDVVADLDLRDRGVAVDPSTSSATLCACATPRAAWARETLIDLTVAVVVVVVAGLSPRRWRIAVDPPSIITTLQAAPTCGVAGPGELLIDLTVTVVVRTVAVLHATWLLKGVAIVTVGVVLHIA